MPMHRRNQPVSVLFSEPKISQSFSYFPRPVRNARVSVLFSEPKISQSTAGRSTIRATPRFQCSSASRKFLNAASLALSVLRRRFQCSSASRKFLNPSVLNNELTAPVGFSALQRAENFSIVCDKQRRRSDVRFSALQRAENFSIALRPSPSPRRPRVSVLFSEPKISQFVAVAEDFKVFVCFSALQRAENFSIERHCGASRAP